MAEAANQSLTDPGPIPGPITPVMLLRFNGIGASAENSIISRSNPANFEDVSYDESVSAAAQKRRNGPVCSASRWRCEEPAIEWIPLRKKLL
jgi:hypothetical protein